MVVEEEEREDKVQKGEEGRGVGRMRMMVLVVVAGDPGDGGGDHVVADTNTTLTKYVAVLIQHYQRAGPN